MARAFERARAAADDLRAAGPRELCWRACEEAANRLGLRQRRFPPPPAGAFEAALPAAARDPHALHAWLTQRPSRFLVDPADRHRYRAELDRFPGSRPRADLLVDNAVLLFGRPVRLAEPWNWHADPVSGAQWPPRRHWTKLSPAGPPGADVRRVWERNRQRDLFVLGRAYWATGDERYAEAAAERLDLWRASNPPEHGINWWSNLEVAVRAIAWTWALHVFRDAPAFTAPRLRELVRLCWLAGRHIERDLPRSIRTMPGNHVIGDAAGLAVVALSLPELADAPRWRRTALAVLEREAAAQVNHDGTHREESPSYHAFVWELLCLVALLARRQRVPMPQTWRAVERMAEPLLVISRPDGSLPASGDDDAAAGFDLCEGSARAFTIAATAAVLFDRADLKAAARDPVEAILWLCGPEGLEQWSALASADVPAGRITAFGAGGRSSWKPDADWWFLRGGTQSRHTHADALHLEAAVQGQVLLEDSGTGSYNASDDWRRYARSTRAHNTVVVDGRDQATMHRTFRWLSPLRVDWRKAGPFDGGWYADATHDGYRRRGIAHRRRVWWHPDWGWLVVDSLEGQGTHDVDQRWHTRGTITRFEGGVRIDGSPGVSLLVATASPLTLDVERAVDGAAEGWLATDYLTREPGTVVSARGRLALPAVVATFLSSQPAPVQVSLDTASGGLSVRLQAAGRVRSLDVPDGD